MKIGVKTGRGLAIILVTNDANTTTRKTTQAGQQAVHEQLIGRAVIYY